MHQDLADIEIREAEHHGSYKELQTIKSGWFERKLKRKLAKSTGPGSLGTLSVSITVFEANLLRNALRRESQVDMVPSAIRESAINASAVKEAIDSIKAEDDIVMQAQQELQTAFLRHRHPSKFQKTDDDNDTGSALEDHEPFEDVVERIMGRASQQLSRLTSDESNSPEDESRRARAADLLAAQKKFFLDLHVNMVCLSTQSS